MKNQEISSSLVINFVALESKFYCIKNGKHDYIPNNLVNERSHHLLFKYFPFYRVGQRPSHHHIRARVSVLVFLKFQTIFSRKRLRPLYWTPICFCPHQKRPRLTLVNAGICFHFSARANFTMSKVFGAAKSFILNSRRLTIFFLRVY